MQIGFGNPELKETKYIALTFSDWHIAYSNQVRQDATILKSSNIAPYLRLIQAPILKNWWGNYYYKWVGQGTRAIAYSATFVQELLATRVNHFIDLHILEMLTTQRNEGYEKWKDQPNLALIADPPLWKHVPSFTKRFRGSGRLQQQAVTTAEEEAYYITVNLNKEWGLSNRLQTIALLASICNAYRFGMYVLWVSRKACPDDFEEFAVIDESSQVFDGIPFIKIYKDEKDSNWRAALRSQHWCKGNFFSQCQVQMGLTYFFNELWKHGRYNRDTHLTDVMLPALQHILTQDFALALINCTDSIHQEAYQYIHPSGVKRGKQVAIHVRRGDHRYANCDAKCWDPVNIPEQKELFEQWEDADTEVQATLMQKIDPSSKNDFTNRDYIDI